MPSAGAAHILGERLGLRAPLLRLLPAFRSRKVSLSPLWFYLLVGASPWKHGEHTHTAREERQPANPDSSGLCRQPGLKEQPFAASCLVRPLKTGPSLPRGGQASDNVNIWKTAINPRRSSQISVTGPGTMRGRWAPGAAGAKAFAALQSCAPDGGGAAPPGRAPDRSRSANRSCQGASACGPGGGAAGARGKPSTDWAA